MTVSLDRSHQTTPAIDRATRPGYRRAVVLGLFVFLVLNANGREIPASDSQAAKYASVALARRGSLTLDGVVGRAPLYAERVAFQRDRHGRWRNAYPLPPVLEGAAVAATLKALGVVHLPAPLAPALVAKVTASALIAIASGLAFAIAAHYASLRLAALVAVGFALGTGLWPTASQTLWQHATVVWSVTLALTLWVRTAGRDPGFVRQLVCGLLIGWAASGRLQTLPMLLVLSAGMLWRVSRVSRLAYAAGFLLPLSVFVGLNLLWFGHMFGRMHEFETTSLFAHRVDSTWVFPLNGLLGLLFSPSRGLLIFSPVILVAIAARARNHTERVLLRFTVAAAVVQALVYSSFSVWWAGHTYGPRYLLDVLPLLIPAAALGAVRIAQARAVVKFAVMALLLWSVVTSATGAFCYPHDAWNTDPASVDHFHSRLWEVRDNQILRCWSGGPSPQNFALFDPDGWRRRQ